MEMVRDYCGNAAFVVVAPTLNRRHYELILIVFALEICLLVLSLNGIFRAAAEQRQKRF